LGRLELGKVNLFRPRTGGADVVANAIFRIDDLPIIELRTRVSAAKEGDNMNYQIQGLSIQAEVHGTAEPALVFSPLLGWNFTHLAPRSRDRSASPDIAGFPETACEVEYQQVNLMDED
jgi:hypothetical protein